MSTKSTAIHLQNFFSITSHRKRSENAYYRKLSCLKAKCVNSICKMLIKLASTTSRLINQDVTMKLEGKAVNKGFCTDRMKN